MTTLEKISQTLGRIVGSKKAVLVFVPLLASACVALFGVDPTEGLMLLVNSGFGLLAGAQLLLDLRWGSTSDGTGETGTPEVQPEPAKGKRGARAATSAALVFLVALATTGCLTYDQGAYLATAQAERSRTDVAREACDAHRTAVAALEDQDGSETTATALHIPLGSAAEIGAMQTDHSRAAQICDQAVELKERGQGDPVAEEDLINAWHSLWTEGASFLGD